MVITYHGENCFKIQSGEKSVVVDPLSEKFKADVTIKTGFPLPVGKPEENLIIGPGEYEVKEIVIRGYAVPGEEGKDSLTTIYSVKMEDIELGFFGHIAKMPDAETIEKLGNAEILFLPVGGGKYLDAKSAAKIVKQLKPSVLIPTYYKNTKEFAEETGIKAELSDKFTTKKKEIVEMGESVKLIFLKA